MRTRTGGAAPRRLVLIGLLPLGAVAVHQLRYLIAYGPAAGRELAEQGDAYVHSLVPWLVLGAVGTVGFWIARTIRRPGPGATGAPLWRTWLWASAALLGAYLAQEAVEVAGGSAHASVLAQAFGHGGWWAVPGALALGLAWALLARGAGAVLARIAAVARRARRREPAAGRRGRPAVVAARRRCVLARRLAGRAPPRPAVLSTT